MKERPWLRNAWARYLKNVDDLVMEEDEKIIIWKWHGKDNERELGVAQTLDMGEQDNKSGNSPVTGEDEAAIAW